MMLMTLDKQQNLYLYLISSILLVLGFYKLFLIICIIKITYYINLESIIPYIYNSIHNDLEHEECYVQDQDIDTSYLVNLFNEEVYLIYRCKFFFDFYGGNTTLSIEDYYSLINFYNNIYLTLDFWIFKNIEDELFKETFFFINKKKFFLLKDVNNITLQFFNLFHKSNFIEILNSKKKFILIKYFKL